MCVAMWMLFCFFLAECDFTSAGSWGAGGEGQTETTTPLIGHTASSLLVFLWEETRKCKHGACFSSPFNLHFHWIFCCFIRKQGWRWKHTLNKLLLRILHSLQRLFETAAREWLFATILHRRKQTSLLTATTENTERMRARNPFTPRHAKNGACHSE